jgi:hypothetical protein
LEVENRLDEAELYYQGKEYIKSMRASLNAKARVALVTDSALISAISAIDNVEAEIENENFFSPNAQAVLDRAREALSSSKDKYQKGLAELEAGNEDAAERLFKEAKEEALAALGLVQEARDVAGPTEDIIRWTLVLVPILIVGLLVLFFYKRLSQKTLRVALSTYVVSANKKAEVIKHIHVTNTTKYAARYVITERTLSGLTPTTSYTEPKEVKENKLVWELSLRPGEESVVSYGLLVPKMEAGQSLELEPTRVSQVTKKGIKLIKSESLKIDIE